MLRSFAEPDSRRAIQMAKKTYEGPAEALEDYESALGAAGIDRKGATRPYTSVNGNMYSFIDPDGLVAVRMSDEDREAFLAEHGTDPVIQYGATMRGYVEVPADKRGDTAFRSQLLSKSLDWASSLPPKPTKRST